MYFSALLIQKSRDFKSDPEQIVTFVMQLLPQTYNEIAVWYKHLESLRYSAYTIAGFVDLLG